ncbi:glycosyltransferase family 4 protein [Allonocardiopsis opalescens]|uniref:Glycosyltransferase involved in cell wall biosynthesis n=1 Tax=Allonocardiopsis opalescens TaxID=1144618 RepID=A0A2T0QBZ0_9ACTN|nr:glycosyltransferase family 4 protein [Allonocardiopsis opalescens]PRY01466.1 glycosyltransferase involved in cell wall biosynthesis [Allonocardiopsis opalescens]
MHVVVATVVHHPEDARILHRQIRALLDAGHQITYLAPFRARQVTPWPELRAIDVPRAHGRRRLTALRAARVLLARAVRDADLLLFHDPELLLALPPRRNRPPVVWDVHEDTAAAILTKPWVPPWLRRPLAVPVRLAERLAEQRMHLLLAEDGYRERFGGHHPVVPNTTYVPDTPPPAPAADRVSYLGALSRVRGALDLVELGRRLAPEGVSVDIVGSADPDVQGPLQDAHRAGSVRWHGFVGNDQALRMLEGSLAGLSLLHDAPNYRHSLPTKVLEYMAHRLPVITTPNPPAVRIVAPDDDSRTPSGIVVPFEDPAAATEAVLRLRDDPALRLRLADTGYRTARANYHWPVQARHFVKQLEQWAAETTPPTHQTRTSAR